MGKRRIKEIKSDQVLKKHGPKKKKPRRIVTKGQAHIKSSYNNTIVTITDTKGDVLVWASAGSLGFKGPKKATSYAASTVVRSLVDALKKMKMEELDILVKGIGSGRNTAIKTLAQSGFTITSLRDVTTLPHNGCRPRKIRRV